ncbi:unnamed protein product [Rhizophagus irregularis]|uniref:Uncharacterized protein n=1 Tax=Rhizophagus irregularis TaxID=588596 RepID=A0A2I1GSV5_9GLOM|nr:hypothetical protein RhiirA4_528425 [Rhizophagus irregularis]CAB4419386.1 unnamed protein product [Rhizophagus irregularis]
MDLFFNKKNSCSFRCFFKFSNKSAFKYNPLKNNPLKNNSLKYNPLEYNPNSLEFTTEIDLPSKKNPLEFNPFEYNLMNANRGKSKAQETAGNTEDEIIEIGAQKNVINDKDDLKLSPEQALLYNSLDEAGRVALLDILKNLREEAKKERDEGKEEGREEGREEGMRVERRRGRFYVNLVIGFLTIVAAALIQDETIIKYGTLLLNTLVHGVQLFWAGVEAIRESSNKNLKYYICTLLGIFVVTIPSTTSNLSRDYFL